LLTVEEVEKIVAAWVRIENALDAVYEILDSRVMQQQGWIITTGLDKRK